MVSKFTSTALAALAVATAAPAQANDLRETLAADMPELMELYRDLHANPELSFEEHETAAKLAARMRALGFEVTEGVGRTGVVSVMRNGDGPTVLLRADMDGLPVVEQTGLPYASTQTATPASGVTTGVMHACGHDTHMAGFIGAARLLVDHKDQWQGTLVMVLQPAEEIGLGALAMLDDGLYTKFPKPDYALAFHDAAAPAPAGTIGYTPGYALANVDSVDITVKGIGGHGAYPHTTVDPVVLASAIVMKLQTVVSRSSSPLDPAVITVGSFHAGAKHNIISDEAKLQLTVRSYSDESRQLLLDGIRRRRGFQPVPPGRARGRQIDDFLDQRYAATAARPARRGRHAAAFAAFALLGARCGEGDCDRCRGSRIGGDQADAERGKLTPDKSVAAGAFGVAPTAVFSSPGELLIGSSLPRGRRSRGGGAGR